MGQGYKDGKLATFQLCVGQTFSKTQCASVSDRVLVKHRIRSSPCPWLCHSLVGNMEK